MCRELDESVKAFLTRPIEGDLDATFHKVRETGKVVSLANVVAIGVCATGERNALGIDVGPAEDRAFWLAFLRSLVARGLTGVRLVISDAHQGLKRCVSRPGQGSKLHVARLSPPIPEAHRGGVRRTRGCGRAWPAGTAPLAELDFRIYAEFTAAGDWFYLSGGPAHLGAELWTVDAQGELTLIKDIDPGPGSSSPHRIGGPAGDLVFTATEPEHGTELWRSDGTPDGTVLVKDIRPGPAGSDPRPQAHFQGTHFVPVSQADGRPLLRAATAPDVCRS